MPKIDNLPIYQKFYSLIKALYKITNNLPKEYKFSLGLDAINLCWRCLDGTLEVNLKRNDEKKALLENLSLEFDRLKLRVRMMHEIGLISLGQLTNLQENYLSEIGRMLGGWQRWAGSENGGGNFDC